MSELTQELLKDLFNYSDGALYWIRSPARPTRAGTRAGRISHGYESISIDYKKRLSHRLIFLYHKGYLPKYLDHINGITTDNRIENIRECTLSQNNFNSTISNANTSGVKGITWSKSCKKWQAQIKKNGKRIYLGVFSDIKDAEACVKKRRTELHGEFVNHG